MEPMSREPVAGTPGRCPLSCVLAVGLAASTHTGWAQPRDNPTRGGSASLEAVEVKGQSTAAGNAAFSGTVQDQQAVRESRVSRVQELFRNVPGMNLTAYGLPGVADAISLRGFGGGGHGGDIGFILDGIPLNEAMSHADGYADLNVIVPLEVRTMTVLRGPVSALYGNYNRAGTVNVDTRKGGEYRQADLSIGSFRTYDLQAAAGVKPGDRQHLNLAAQTYSSDGFRPQSDGDRHTLAGRWSLAATPDLEIALSGRAHRVTASNPGYLTETQFDTDPYGIDRRMKNDGSKKTFHTLRADVNHRLASDLKLLTFVYGTQQDFTRWFTRGAATAATWSQREETYERGVSGAGFNLNGLWQVAGAPLNWVAGVETFRERTDYLKYEGTDFRRRVGTAEYDRRFALYSVAVFGEATWALHPLFNPTLGLRWDRFTGDCALQGAETASDPCGRIIRVSHTSPKVGFRSRWNALLQTRASVAEGFALAPEMVKYALGASAVSPNVFRQTEIGANLKLPANLVLDAALYRLTSSDEIVGTAPGVYENAGSTRRTGVEFSALWAPVSAFDLSVAFGIASSRIETNPATALIGNRVTAVPRSTATVVANWRPLAGWQGTVIWRKVGDYAVNAANTLVYGGYHKLDLAVAHTFTRAQPITLYMAIDNVTDRVYATAVSTVGYATGAPRSVRVGAQMSF